MESSRKISLSAGLLYLLTFVSIPSLFLYKSVKSPGYVLGAGPDTAAVVGGILEIVVALAGIATAVVLFQVLKKQSATLAVGLVASRVLEAGTMFVGVAFILSIVALRKSGAGADALATSNVLAVLHGRIFLLGQSFIPAINDILLGIMLYRSRLVPRLLSLVGIIGAFPLIAGYFAVLFGFIEHQSPLAGLSAFPVAFFEFGLGLWLVFKGFSKNTADS